jgi:restriction system protein
MPSNEPALIALAVALLAGIAASVYLFKIQRKRLIAAAGIQALARMRWREFSEFVVTALQAQGFEAAPLDEGAASRELCDLLLKRENRSWLLACRQSPDYRVSGKHVEEMRKAVRMHGAAGGVIATLGRIDVPARPTSERIELVDGRALWELIAPLLPTGLSEHIDEQAHRQERNWLLAIWATAFVAGFAVAIAAGLVRGDRSPGAGASTAHSVVAPPADAPDPTATTDESAARQQVLDEVARLPGVRQAVWPTRSTLLVLLESETVDPRPGICAVLERYDTRRASRLQLQPPSGSTAPVRFTQCRLY